MPGALNWSHTKIAQDRHAYEVSNQLAPGDIRVASDLPVSHEDRQAGRAIPEYHASLLGQFLKSLEDRGHLPKELKQAKALELGRVLTRMSQAEARAFIAFLKANQADDLPEGEDPAWQIEPRTPWERRTNRKRPTRDGGVITCTCCGRTFQLLHEDERSRHTVKSIAGD